MPEFRMPSLGADMEAGTLVEWLVKPGQNVKRGDVVAVVETDKGAVDVEIWESGSIDTLLVPPGTKVPVGTTLATLRALAAAPPSVAVPTPPPAPAPLAPPLPAAAPSAVAAAPPVPAPSAGPVRASPAARKRAHELAVDITGLAGTGLHGAITFADVEAAATARAPSLPASPPTPSVAQAPGLAGGAVDIRRAIGAAMARSKREIPHYYLASEVDLGGALEWLTEENRKRSVTGRILPTALFLKATALAVQEVPSMNGFWIDGAFRPSGAIHLGVGISLRGNAGLIAPALRDVAGKPLDALMRELGDLIVRARSGHLRSSELSDATLTVTSLGEQGVETVFGVIYPPQVALVGFGAVTERPRAIGGLLGVRPVMNVTLSGDHRASDGITGARFLAAIARRLGTPEDLK
ncbi:MAG TPA: dihydrolipoamide acetyltransferase family protein [Polyangia bacterium]|jgi:pyruvate dehydrogenase E2 component (dihydrolipoamide acetyltransferase)|nr:dihydrolipoamide acetyltransferase family protein [Polyangia bacterium]